MAEEMKIPIRGKCIIDGCEVHVHSKNMCQKHYRRVLKYGDPFMSMKEFHGRRDDRLYEVWRKIIDRCFNPGRKEYHRYGGRGITMCREWRISFSRFMDDMGEPPSPKHQVDRIDNDGNYEKGNCRWATAMQNSRNKSNNKLSEATAALIRSSNLPNADLCKIFKVSYGQIWRVKTGKSWPDLSNEDLQ